jgi:hypothetical protein
MWFHSLHITNRLCLNNVDLRFSYIVADSQKTNRNSDEQI